MKGSDYLIQTIQAYLKKRADEDELFAPVYANPKKNIEDCITYILNTVKESGCHGFADDEIYSLALHYYDEPDIKVGKKLNCNVVVNHHIELTEKEKADAHRKALKRVENEAYAQMKKGKAKPKKTDQSINQLNLF